MNNREIKFKRYHFRNPEKTQLSHVDIWGVINAGTFVSPSHNNFAMYFEDCQFTGMKDKNKQECYEGDFVKIRDEQLRKIVYYENGFEMRLLNDKRDSNSTTWYYDFEIIGNIYHNPELLK